MIRSLHDHLYQFSEATRTVPEMISEGPLCKYPTTILHMWSGPLETVFQIAKYIVLRLFLIVSSSFIKQYTGENLQCSWESIGPPRDAVVCQLVPEDALLSVLWCRVHQGHPAGAWSHSGATNFNTPEAMRYCESNRSGYTSCAHLSFVLAPRFLY